MMARMGDRTSHGGTIVSGDPERISGLRPLARMGDFHACPEHGLNTIIEGDREKILDGKPVARLGDATGCGAIIIGKPQIIC